MATIQELYEKFNKGDALADMELRVLRQHFHALERQLIVCGPVFHLAWCEAARVARTLDDFYKARGLLTL